MEQMMEQLTAEALGQIITLVIIAITGSLIFERRAQIMSALGDLRDRYITSSNSAGVSPDQETPAEKIQYISTEERNGETGEKSIAEPKTTGYDPFQFPDGFLVLARLIEAGKIDQTEGMKIGLKVSPGGSAKYKEARSRLLRAIEETKEGATYTELDREDRPKVLSNVKD
jgi:hypothetical protein